MTKKSSKQVGSTRSNPQTKFSKKQIKAIVEQIERGSLTRTEACQKYGMAYGTVLDWMKRHGSSSAAATKRVQLSPQQQRQAASAVVEGRMSIKEVQAAYNIAYPGTVRRWVRVYKQQNSELTAFHQSSSQMPPSTDTTTTDQQDKELQQARLKIAALETMIDVAEQHFNISIRKKPGAKQ
jgi:transposase-like protein